ncbi:hypothetical protein J437_LFUL011729 [Ladona fulva]|uniref:DDE Tnp4 domain-containing protein n=1 Tax=Ladona fulva TaxID=123851 RepID=A0A8K0KD47_LADFU|nr:hypothetical protein J437_LFUL011729 [Ladona fulva]
MDIVTRWPGSSHDQTIFNNSYLKHRIISNAFNKSVVSADSGYKLENYMLTPIRKPISPQDRQFNESHMRRRNMTSNLSPRPTLISSITLRYDALLAVG